MIPIHGLLALSLSALAAAGSPLPPAGNTAAPPLATTAGTFAAPSTVDELRLDVSGEVHHWPDQIMTIDEDTELSGVFVLDSFIVLNGAVITATDDLSIFCRRMIVVDGDIVGIPDPDEGTSILLKSFDVLFMRGDITAGEGTDGTATKGGSVFLSGERTTLIGTFKAAEGGSSAKGLAGEGGESVAYGEYDPRYKNQYNLLGGRGGYPGGDGGNAGWLTPGQEVLAVAFGSPMALMAPSFAYISAASRADDPVDPPGGSIVCEKPGKGNQGDDFSDQVIGAAGKLADGPDGPLPPCCAEGGDGSSGATDQLASDGGAGDEGQSPPSNPYYKYHGGDGGDGGDGGSAIAKSGGDGGDATDCCLFPCDQPTGRKGGDGGKPEYAKGGDGGARGGAGVPSDPLCSDGFLGSGGAGGDTTHGYGGSGGKGGKGLTAGGPGGTAGEINSNKAPHGIGCGTGGPAGPLEYDANGNLIDPPTKCHPADGGQGEPGAFTFPPLADRPSDGDAGGTCFP